MDIDRLRVLRALRLKGRVPAPELASAAGLEETRGTVLVEEMIGNGHAEEVRGRLKLTVSGREHLDEQLKLERQGIDQEVVGSLYKQFDEYNSALKSLMTRWQLKADDTPNDHGDLEYDTAVIEDLVVLDKRFQPLLARMVEAAPRLGHYPARFCTALAHIEAGDHSWFAKPLIDSYHTVWFELHEDLIGLAGLTRADEAAAGRAE